MPFANMHTARQRSPDDFESIKTLGGGKGVQILGGQVKGGDGKAVIQSIHFDKTKFTADEARAWLKEHGHSTTAFVPARKDDVAASMDVPLELGDVAGHDFHGNQYTHQGAVDAVKRACDATNGTKGARAGRLHVDAADSAKRLAKDGLYSAAASACRDAAEHHDNAAATRGRASQIERGEHRTAAREHRQTASYLEGMAQQNGQYLRGDRVSIKPQWRDPGDESREFRIIEDRGNNAIIENNAGLPINPQQNVRKDMIEPYHEDEKPVTVSLSPLPVINAVSPVPPIHDTANHTGMILDVPLELGDVTGHPFHGNQHTAGGDHYNIEGDMRAAAAAARPGRQPTHVRYENVGYKARIAGGDAIEAHRNMAPHPGSAAPPIDEPTHHWVGNRLGDAAVLHLKAAKLAEAVGDMEGTAEHDKSARELMLLMRQHINGAGNHEFDDRAGKLSDHPAYQKMKERAAASTQRAIAAGSAYRNAGPEANHPMLTALASTAARAFQDAALKHQAAGNQGTFKHHSERVRYYKNQADRHARGSDPEPDEVQRAQAVNDYPKNYKGKLPVGKMG